MDEHPEAAGEQKARSDDREEPAAFDLAHAKAVAAFVLRAPKRRPVLTTLLAVMLGAIAVFVAQSIAPLYRAELHLIAQPAGADEARNAEVVQYGIEVARSHDVLARVVDEADLVARSDRARPRTLRLRDRFLTWLGRGGSAVDARASAIGSLRTRLSMAQEGTNISIGVTWTDPQGAYDAANAERESFLRAVYDAHVKVAVDRKELADVASQKAYSELEDALRAYAELWSRPKAPSAPRGVVAAVKPPALPNPLVDEVAAKEQRVRQAETVWRAALDRRNEELTEALRRYTGNHPIVVELEHEVGAMSQPPEDLVAAREELRALRDRLQAEVRAEAPSPHPAAQAGPPEASGPDDGASLIVRSRLDAAMHNHIAADEAATREAAFVDVTRRQARDRYIVGAPAEVPAKPVRSFGAVATIAAVLAAALIALLLSSLLDIWSGRIVESWQVRRLKIEPLGELER